MGVIAIAEVVDASVALRPHFRFDCSGLVAGRLIRNSRKLTFVVNSL